MAEPMQSELELEQNVEIEVGAEAEAEDSQEQVKVQQEDSGEEEIAEYSDSVKKRINKLTYKVREAERREQAAVEYARNVQEKLNSTQKDLTQKDKNLYDEYSARVASQLSSAEEQYKKAHKIGDTEALLSSQKEVAKLAVELESLNRVKPQQKTKEHPIDTQQPQVQQPQVQQPQVQQPQVQPKPDAKAQKWATKNEWFGNDLAMTTSAFAFHRQLVENEGFDPASDEYYQEVDRRMSDSFPTKLGRKVSQVNNVQENVANSSRGARGKTGKGRTVKLTPSQVSIAKRLGVPLEEYAKYVK